MEHVKSHAKMYRELILFIIFVILFMIITFMHRDVFSTHLMNTAVKTALVDESAEQGYDFADIKTWSEMNDYFNGVLGPVLTTCGNDSYAIMHSNRLIGGVRLRQLRVRNDSCTLSPAFKKIFKSCYAQGYSSGTKDKNPYGPAENPTKYTYSSGQKSGSASIWGRQGGLYEGGGYVTDYSINTDFSEAFLELQNDNWWDQQTRVVIATIPFANANLHNRISLLYLVFEMNAAGQVNTYSMARSFRFNLYVTSGDWVRLGLEITFSILIIYFIFIEISEIYTNWKEDRSLWKYFTTLWNYVEVANLGVLVACIGMYIKYLRFSNVDLTSTEYIPQLEQMGELFQNVFNLTSINVLLCAFNIFKYLTLNTRLYLLWHTLGSAGTDLFYFLFIFLVVFFGFVMMAHLTFGADSEIYSSFVMSIGSCWQFIIGNPPDFDSLFATNRVLGPLFYSLFTVFIFFVLVNMFIAIVTNAFTEQHGRVRVLKQATSITQFLWSSVMAVKETFRGERSLTDHAFLKTLGDKDVLDLHVLTTEDAARAIGPGATLSQIERLKALHLRFRHAQNVEMRETPGEVDINSPESSDSGNSQL